MPQKHFLNDPTHLVSTALHANTITNPAVALDVEGKILYLRPNSHDHSQVSIISGGGSGHEPSFAAFVGQGLLSAAVIGTIFASPSAKQVYTAIASRVETSQGVLVVVMNYTGDVLNFGVAAEKARANGCKIEMVVVGDDVGVTRAKSGKVGRRGIAGVVLVQKIVGALAARGADLESTARVARLVAENLVSIGASLGHVHVPGHSSEHIKVAKVGHDEVEIGTGIHNEPGFERVESNLPELIKRMLARLLDEDDLDRAYLKLDQPTVILLVNNLGGISVIEIAAIVTEVVSQLRATYNIIPIRTLSGTFMTSLNGQGFSITLLNIVETGMKDHNMIDLLDHPCEAVGWSAPVGKTTWEARNPSTRLHENLDVVPVEPYDLQIDAETAGRRLIEGLSNIILAEPEITRFDTLVGDGDCGIGLKRGAEAIIKHLQCEPFTGELVADVAVITSIVERTMDGTSGALYAIFLNALLASLRNMSPGLMAPHTWGIVLQQSCSVLSKYTPARPGDRTMIDALYPFIDVFVATQDIKKAALAAKSGAESTKGMQASLGRAVYVGGSNFEQVPDPGAYALACFLIGLSGM